MEMVKEVLSAQAEQEEKQNSFAGGITFSGCDVKITVGDMELGAIQNMEYTVGIRSDHEEDSLTASSENVIGRRSSAARLAGIEGSVSLESVIIDEEFLGLITQGVERQLEEAIFRGSGISERYFDETIELYQSREKRRKKKKGMHQDNADKQKLNKMLGGKRHWK